MSKVLWEHHSTKKFLDAKKKFSYRFGVKKASKSKFASVRLKTYLNEKKQNLLFLWVKTPMGLERFVAHFLTLFSMDHKVLPNRPKNRECFTLRLLSENFCEDFLGRTSAGFFDGS